jgi:aryl-alcohol dehydrogenase-like predicted oxidoreductase
MVRAFAAGSLVRGAQQQFNVFGGNQETLELCHRLGLASLCRSPLAMGLLTGKYRPGSGWAPTTCARSAPWWDYFKPGPMEAWLEQLRGDPGGADRRRQDPGPGRAGWLWARSAITIPIPGFKTVAQAEENAHAMAFGRSTTGSCARSTPCSIRQAQP